MNIVCCTDQDLYSVRKCNLIYLYIRNIDFNESLTFFDKTVWRYITRINDFITSKHLPYTLGILCKGCEQNNEIAKIYGSFLLYPSCIYCYYSMSKNSCPIFIVYSPIKNEQDFFRYTVCIVIKFLIVITSFIRGLWPEIMKAILDFFIQM